MDVALDPLQLVVEVVHGRAARLEDRTDDVQRSQLFRVRDDEAIATMADEWHMALIAKGFTELEIVRQPDGPEARG